jgi:hypothetical protein
MTEPVQGLRSAANPSAGRRPGTELLRGSARRASVIDQLERRVLG